MFDPVSTISVTDWMLQSVNKSTQKQRAQALDSAGNEHAFAYWGARNTETAEFVLGGSYGDSDTLTLPALGSGITDWTLVYSETEFPKLTVNKDAAAGGGTFDLTDTKYDSTNKYTFPARTLGVPATIAGIYSNLTGAKTVTIACSCQHVEEPDGTGTYGTHKGMRDAVVTVTIEGIDGKPSFDTTAQTYGFEAGWGTPSDQESKSNTAIGTGSIVYEKHFAVSAAS